MLKTARYELNPLISPDDVAPILEGCEVVGVFNAASAVFHDEIILILRVAERPKESHGHQVNIPIYQSTSKSVEFTTLDRNDSQYDFSDSRVVQIAGSSSGQYLTSMSYLRLARSHDGYHFHVEDKPFLFPDNDMEEFGIEDPRCAKLGDTFSITYTAVSRHGASVGLATTKDFQTVMRKGIIFPPENKDVVLFPEMINGRYYAIHRPVPHGLGAPEMWISDSKDGTHWGNHRFFLGLRPGHWDSQRIGAGAVPIKTQQGWLEIYHAVDDDGRYCLGCVLLDLQDPSRILARLDAPIVVPEANYEVHGFYPNVIFTCGVVVFGELLRIYYGAADYAVACLDLSLPELLDELTSASQSCEASLV